MTATRRPANFHVLATLSPAQRKALLTRTETDLSSFTEKVRPIVAAVRTERFRSIGPNAPS